MAEPVRLSRGLYRPADAVATLADRCAAFLDVAPAGTVVGGLTAARVRGHWLPEPRPGERVELVLTRDGVRPHELAGTRRCELRLRRRVLTDQEIVVQGGLPMSSDARTWVDCAEYLRIEDVVALGDSILRAGTTAYELAVAVQAARRRRGVLKAREALPLLNARSRSRPESYLRCVLVRGGIPTPEVNVPLHDAHGQWVAEPDLLLRRARIAIEYNGAFHDEQRRYRNDMTRTLDIDDVGWKVLAFGPAEVFGAQPRALYHVRRELDRRDPGWWRRRDA